MNNNNKTDKSASVVVSSTDYPLPIELRPIWRIGLICIIISTLGNDSASMKLNKVRVLLWMLIRPQKWNEFHSDLNLHTGNIPVIASDKSTDKAIELALAKEFLCLSAENLELDTEGKVLVDLITDLKLFIDEVEFLLSIKNKLTENYIKRILGN